MTPFKKIESEGKIIVYKHFNINEIGSGIYRDLFESDKFYFVLPESINWKILTYLTRQVKGQLSNPEFDAALGLINRFNGPVDVIRIYDRDQTLERSIQLSKLYYKALKKENQLIITK